MFITNKRGCINIINDMIKAQMDKSNGEVKIVKVPKSKKLSKQSLYKLDEKIRSQVKANADMERKSMIIAKLSGIK